MLVMSQDSGTGNKPLGTKDCNATVKVPLHYSQGVAEETIHTLCNRFPLDRTPLTAILDRLFTFFKECDVTFVKIKLLELEDVSRGLVCDDVKMSIDNAASQRQTQIFNLRDKSQEMAVELEAEKHGLVYIQLEGNIGCLVNGAGLAMATNDAVAEYGGSCANFLDGGGQATKATMVKAFELILSDKRVNTILVNIFGAESIIAAAQNFRGVPIVVRLQGTNSAQGQKMIAESGLELFAEDEFGDAVRKAIEMAGPNPYSGAVTSKASMKSDESSIFDLHSPGRHSVPTHSPTSRDTNKRTGPAWSDIKQDMTMTRAVYASQTSYSSTISNLNIDQDTGVIIQGFTGKAATTNALATQAYGTKIIGGVTPSIRSPGFHPNPSLSHLPVFPTLRTALTAFPAKPHATAVLVPALHAASAILEAIEAEIPLIVSVAEHVPLHDMFRVQAALRTQSASRLVGPNCPGIIAPPAKCRIGIMPHLQYQAGCVGILSKSGTLSYEAVGATTKVGLGQSLCIGVGGDMLPGTSLREGLEALLRDEGTKGIVLLGEIGGEAEIEAAEFLMERDREVMRKGGRKKPVVGMITGRTAPEGRVMGHAGAENGGDPTSNSELATLMVQAKKAGFPKDLIERAIAKGRGLSLSGDPLQTMTVEAMLPPSVAVMIECQTDSKKRTREDLRLLMKEAGGMVTPTSHLFERRGHIMLESDSEINEEDIMEQVLEAGAIDMELEGDLRSLSVYTEPNQTASIAQKLSSSLGLTFGNSEIIWVARTESTVDIDEAEEEPRLAFYEVISTHKDSSTKTPAMTNSALGQIEEDSSVQAVFHNAV
ncbi:MAG: hypothetical protein Q9169_005046 [Polycauliona sp. 2 TL-2023]